MDSGLSSLIVCPRDKLRLALELHHAVCARGHRYAIVEGIPILLLSEMQQTHIEGTRSLAIAESPDAAQLPQFHVGPGEIDPFVSNSIGATNGALYQHLVGKLKAYPIPNLRLPDGKGDLFLEIGCNWGRWCIAAARKGYRVVGIDPSLKAIRAARRVAWQLGIEADYLVADARALPFPDRVFKQVFSYSVLQHLSKENVSTILPEIQRVLRQGGNCQVQMPNVFGLRCLYHQLRRRFRQARDFEVRYWTPCELKSVFESLLGPSKIVVDGYFSLNAQASDLDFLPIRYRSLVRLSEGLRRTSGVFAPLRFVADSLYVNSRVAT